MRGRHGEARGCRCNGRLYGAERWEQATLHVAAGSPAGLDRSLSVPPPRPAAPLTCALMSTAALASILTVAVTAALTAPLTVPPRSPLPAEAADADLPAAACASPP
jgi:hypothetical protein